MGDLSGQLLEGRYQIQDRISDGAMGVVYRAVRTGLDRPVAVKVMHASLADAMKGKERFEREALVMARLEHPHCVSIIDFGIHANKPYVVMELVRGRSLFELLAEQGRFEIARAVEILRQVLSGLAHAHDQGIIHRDVKPANIMCTPKAPLGVHVRILDFGLARMLGSSASISDGVTVGTPSYMAPEQCRGDTLDHRVDIYACGVVLFEMLTGKKPFVADEPIDIIKQQLQAAPPRLADVTPGDYGKLEDVVARALAKAPADRYASAVAMADALEAAIGGQKLADTTAPLVPVPDDDRSQLRRELPVSRARWWALLVLVLVAGGAGAVIYLQQRDEAPAAPPVVVPVDAAPVVIASDGALAPADAIVANAQQLAAAGKLDAAIELLVDARKVYPAHAALPATAGKLYFSKLWWADGIASFRAAIKLDPTLREDPEILDAVVRGFTTTPGFDSRLAGLLLEIGTPAASRLDAVAATHANPGIRARAAAMRKRLR